MRSLAIYVNMKFSHPLLIAEVGVECGLNAIEMMQKMNIKKIYLVDPYTAFAEPSVREIPQNVQDDCYKIMFKNMEKYLDPSVLVTQDSVFASSLFTDEFFDFVYVDANHDYEHVKQDVNAWWPKVKVGGVMGGHDYKGIPTVEEAVKEFVSQHNLKLMEFLTDERQTEWGIVK